MRNIIDGHLDLAWNAASFDRDLTLSLDQMRQTESKMTDVRARAHATTTFPEMKAASIRICIVTLLARSGPLTKRQSAYRRTDLDFPYNIGAYAAAHGQLACYELWQQQGHIRLLRTRDELEHHWARCLASEDTPLGVVLTMEGADPISNVEQLSDWYDKGLRAIGLSHYGFAQYASGTETEGGLTEDGFRLLDEMARLGFALDVTHLADQAMREAIERFVGPVWASHHNSRSLVPGQRQLSDEQITNVIQRDGVIGAALDAWMLYPNWVRGETEPMVVGIESVADHIDYVCQMAGNVRHSAIGSDLDGGFGTEQTPHDLNSIADLQKLDAILSSRGYNSGDIDAIFHGNWLRMFRAVLPETSH